MPNLEREKLAKARSVSTQKERDKMGIFGGQYLARLRCTKERTGA